MCMRPNRATRNERILQIDVPNEFVDSLPLAKVSLPVICNIALNHSLFIADLEKRKHFHLWT